MKSFFSVLCDLYSAKRVRQKKEEQSFGKRKGTRAIETYFIYTYIRQALYTSVL